LTSFDQNILHHWMTEFPDLCSHAYFGFGRAGQTHETFWHDGKTAPILSQDISARDLQFDIASLTKALVTTPLVLKHFEDRLQQPIADFIADDRLGSVLPVAFIQNTSIADLLKHTSGLPPWSNFWVNQIHVDGRSKLVSSGEQVEHIATVYRRLQESLFLGAADKYIYSDLGFLLLQRILEITTKRSFDDLWQQFCQKNPAFCSINFAPGAQNCIPTADCKLRNTLVRGVVHDENAFALGGFCGHAGGFSSGPHLLSLLKQVASGMDGTHLLDFVLSDKEHLLGWQKSTSAASQAFGGGRAVGHLGFTGGCFWIEPESKSYFVLLTNRTYMKRLDSRMQQLRQKAGSYSWNFLHVNECP